ncbi:hypothetical protein JQN59_18160 [Citrobacter sp. B72]|uniref:hypothetical protein n=1 Tax=Citrobacter sp. B72 TaxID=2807631 RepID=UPI001959D7EA|nr:hypothetical protein [Citrobacter sp. B72]QRQ73085.1 hypothetical protein JQN59_18160 [Citrobacter sp. B72]
MSTITRELAKLFRKITNSEIDAEGNAHVVLSPADSLLINNARIALASLEAEAVACIDRANLDYLESGADADVWPASGAGSDDVLLYAAPQLPQPAVLSVPDEIPKLKDGMGFKYVKDGVRYSLNYANGWNACRAAMLQAGNYPVTPDGLVSCGENCWSCGKYFTYEQHSECDGYCPHCDSPVDLDDEEDEQSKSLPANPTEEMISNAWREALGKCDHETIRRMYVAMFAAAPQQEVK